MQDGACTLAGELSWLSTPRQYMHSRNTDWEVPICTLAVKECVARSHVHAVNECVITQDQTFRSTTTCLGDRGNVGAPGANACTVSIGKEARMHVEAVESAYQPSNNALWVL